jgi:hypothetical protein
VGRLEAVTKLPQRNCSINNKSGTPAALEYVEVMIVFL